MSSPTPCSTRQRIEIVVRFVLGLAFAIAAGAYFRSSYSALMTTDPTLASDFPWGRALSIFTIGLYTTMIACLYLIRFRPLSTFPGFFPTLAALLGGFLMAALLFLEPHEDLPLWAQIVSCSLVALGNGLAVIVLSHLGRSFSILPESRKLVTHGAYAFVRHPLYLAEAIASLGVLIVFFSPIAVAIVAMQFGWQLVRMHYEEKVLRETFPEYALYAAQTKRLIPGLY